MIDEAERTKIVVDCVKHITTLATGIAPTDIWELATLNWARIYAPRPLRRVYDNGPRILSWL